MLDPSEVINYRKKVHEQDNKLLHKVDKEKKAKKEEDLKKKRQKELIEGRFVDYVNQFDETVQMLATYFPKVSRLVAKTWLKELDEVMYVNREMSQAETRRQ